MRIKGNVDDVVGLQSDGSQSTTKSKSECTSREKHSTTRVQLCRTVFYQITLQSCPILSFHE